ncbi:hypothetical protein BD560DRAFT_423987 [Blakeslea trispora]|nr:hypothetical protein BD560DRAFT_423987 [Blakeslea trispora]
MWSMIEDMRYYRLFTSTDLVRCYFFGLTPYLILYTLSGFWFPLLYSEQAHVGSKNIVIFTTTDDTSDWPAVILVEHDGLSKKILKVVGHLFIIGPNMILKSLSGKLNGICVVIISIGLPLAIIVQFFLSSVMPD